MADVQWFRDKLVAGGDREAIVWRDRSYTYQWLAERVEAFERRFSEHGIAPGDVVAVVADFSPVSCALFVALVLNRNVVVPLTSVSIGEQQEFLAVAQVQHVVSVTGDDEMQVTSRNVTPQHPMLLDIRAQDVPGLILFSSGSTGKNKAALHDFSLLLEKFQVERPTLRTITFLMFDHIGGVNTLFYILANHGTVITIASRDPDAVCGAIARHRVALLPTSPSFLNLLLLSEAYRRYDLSPLEKITYGTEVMPQSTLAKLAEVFPKVRLMQTYGLSELGILRAKSRGNDSLWVKVGGEGFETRVVDGILHIRARSAMIGYLNAPSPFDEEGWMNTGDAVEVDGEWLKILGRKSEIINVGGQKVYPAEVESVLLQMPNVTDATVYGEPNALLGNIVVARLTLSEPVETGVLKREVKSFCRDRLAPFKIPQKILVTGDEQHNYRFKKIRRADDPRTTGAATG